MIQKPNSTPKSPLIAQLPDQVQDFLSHWKDINDKALSDQIINALFVLDSEATPFDGVLAWLDWSFNQVISKGLDRVMLSKLDPLEPIYIPILTDRLIMRCFIIITKPGQSKKEIKEKTLAKLSKQFKNNWMSVGL